MTNYTLAWGTNCGVYLFQANAGTQTTLTVTDLSSNTIYYFAVFATMQDGTQCPNSAEIVFTNSPATAGTNAGGTTNSPGTGGGGSGGSGGAGNGSGSTNEVCIPGIPPMLVLSFTNQHPLLAVSGLLGSVLLIQSSTNPADRDSWTTMTNLAMTNPAPGAPANPATAFIINLAFVPAAQNWEVVDPAPPSCEFFQAVMPYDCMVLADFVLSGQGYASRLVVVTMPGIPAEDVCYVTTLSSFIYYDVAGQALGVEPSGSAIREVAGALSTMLGQNWTSASEFSYSNGVTTILATVVEADAASTDPVAGPSTASIQIDF
jgi:hypothetical protein